MIETVNRIAERIRDASAPEGVRILAEYNNNALEAYRVMCRFAQEETERADRAGRQLDLIASLFRGLAQSERGEPVDLGDFAQYL